MTRGVSRAKGGKKWRAYACLNGRQVGLGVFDTIAEAISARATHDVKHSPQMTRINWIAIHKGHDGNDCLEWPFSDGDGYPTVSLPNGRWSKAHREMCRAAHGPAPFSGAMALHSCDNKRCVNPRHIRWGDHRQNMLEAIERGRVSTGERAPNAKITAEDVICARRDRTAGMAYAAIAEKYGVTKGAIWHAVNGSQWKCAK